MSPEQAKGVKELDAGTDIYSLGVVIYELVVGRLPFSADTPFAIIHDHIYTPLPMPHDVNPNVPEAIERVLLKALAKERADRYPDVAAMVAAFREAAANAGQTPTALPHAVPVSPSVVTPSATTRQGSAPEVAAGTVVSPPAAVPAPAAPAKTGYRFQWWHALIALVVMGACLFGLFAVNRFRNRAQREPTAVATTLAPTPASPATPLPLAATPTQFIPPTPIHTVESPPLGGDLDVKVLLDEAQRRLNDKRIDDAAALLDKAVSISPDNIEVWLAAGDMTFSHGHVMLALEKYYIPGVNRTQPPLEPAETELRSHAGLAFYMLAPDPGADQFLLEQSKAYPEAELPQLAYQRWRIFHGQGDAARDELLALIRDNQRNPAAYLILGDFFLSIGRPAEAGANYKLAQELDAPAPQWIRLEAACNLQRIRDQKAETKLQPSCNEPPALLQGKP